MIVAKILYFVAAAAALRIALGSKHYNALLAACFLAYGFYDLTRSELWWPLLWLVLAFSSAWSAREQRMKEEALN